MSFEGLDNVDMSANDMDMDMDMNTTHTHTLYDSTFQKPKSWTGILGKMPLSSTGVKHGLAWLELPGKKVRSLLWMW